MRFEQVKDVLEHVIDYHSELADEYHKLLEQAPDERTRMLLGYLADHEQQMRKGLEGYRSGDHRSVLNTWMQNTPDLGHPEALQEFRGRLCCTSVDEVLDLAERIHDTLGEMYRALATGAVIADERELFESLAERQVTEKKRLSRDVARLDSY